MQKIEESTPDVATLIYVLNSLGTDRGTTFFVRQIHTVSLRGWWKRTGKKSTSTSRAAPRVANSAVNTYSMIEVPLNPQFRKVEYEFLMRQHCRDVYQPLKTFMTLHLHHVRYVRFPRGLSKASDSAQRNEWINVIAGFTLGGILCGVCLTDVRLPRVWAADRLAPGAYPFDESTIDRTRLRIAYLQANHHVRGVSTS